LTSPEPFEGGPLGDLMRSLARFLTGQGPINWEIAREMARWAATGNEPEPNPDPLARVRLEELMRVAEMHVSEATGLTVAHGVLAVATVTRTQWAWRTLEDWKPYLERLSGRMTASAGAGGAAGEEPTAWFGAGEEADSGGADPMARLFAGLPQVIGPFLFGLQAGSMVGQLATRAMGQYDLPMPRPERSELMIVAATIDGFATDWSLAPDDVRMWICLQEAANHAVLSRPHVRARLEELINDYVDAFSPSTQALDDRMAGIDFNDMASLQQALGDPAALLQEMQNDRQRAIQGPLRCLLAAVVGYVDHVMDTVGRRLIGDYGPLTEAQRRRRLEESGGARVLGQLFGVTLDAASYEAGQEFVRGVLERAGEDGLARLWRSERELPTPAELAAPGLWLARIDLDTD
jgi:putative hydrolase